MANIPLYIVSILDLEAGQLPLEVEFGWPELHATQSIRVSIVHLVGCVYSRRDVSTQMQAMPALRDSQSGLLLLQFVCSSIWGLQLHLGTAAPDGAADPSQLDLNAKAGCCEVRLPKDRLCTQVACEVCLAKGRLCLQK